MLAAVAGLAGCASQSLGNAEPTEEAAAAEQKAATAQPREGMGPDHLLVVALHELDLTAAQRTTVQAALDKLAPQDRPAPPAVLLDGIRAGKIDEAAVTAKMKEMEAGMTAHHAAVADALKTLHDTLTADQRRALVDNLEKRAEEHRKDHGGPEGRPNGPPDGEMRGKHGAPGMFLLKDLDLSDAQRTQIEAALSAQQTDHPAPPDAEAMKKHMEEMHTQIRARLEAFAGATFDATAFAAPPAPPAGAPNPKAHHERMLKDLAVVVPLLTPAQRTTLADKIEKGPMGPPPGGHMHPPM